MYHSRLVCTAALLRMCYPTTRPLPLARPLTLSLHCPHLPLHVQAAAAVGVQAQEAFPAAIPPGRAVSCCWHGALLDALLSELASHTELPCNATSGPQAPSRCRQAADVSASRLGAGSTAALSLARGPLPAFLPPTQTTRPCTIHAHTPVLPPLASAPNPKAGWQGCFFP